MEGVEAGESVGAVSEHSGADAVKRFAEGEISRFRVEFVGIAYQAFLDRFGQEIAVWQREVLGDNVVYGESGAGVPLGYPGVAWQAATAQYFTADESVADVWLSSTAQYRGSVGCNYPDVVEQCSLFDKVGIDLQISGPGTFESHVGDGPRVEPQQLAQVGL